MSNIGKKYSTGILKSAEMAAIGASKLIGGGDKEGADQLAVDAMRSALNEIDLLGILEVLLNIDLKYFFCSLVKRMSQFSDVILFKFVITYLLP